MIYMLKYHLKLWCLVIYKHFYRAIVFCNTRLYTFEHHLSPIATSKKNRPEFMIMQFLMSGDNKCYWWLKMFQKIVSYIAVHSCLIKKAYE